MAKAKTKFVGVRVDEGKHSRLREMAEEQGVTVAELLNQKLDDVINSDPADFVAHEFEDSIEDTDEGYDRLAELTDKLEVLYPLRDDLEQQISQLKNDEGFPFFNSKRLQAIKERLESIEKKHAKVRALIDAIQQQVIKLADEDTPQVAELEQHKAASASTAKSKKRTSAPTKTRADKDEQPPEADATEEPEHHGFGFFG